MPPVNSIMIYKSGAKAAAKFLLFPSARRGISARRRVGKRARRARYPETRNILPLGAKFAEQPPPLSTFEENV